ncbi:hypothetical protein [Rhodopirellula bahusiensis]|nr:hypothetical protein [Rhodopirellula bahusiensis]
MNAIDSCKRSLANVDARISDVRQAINKNPEEAWKLELSLSSLQSQRKLLEKEIDELSLQAGREVCSYRIVDTDALPIASLGESLVSFQEVFTTIYSAAKQDSEKRTRVPHAHVAESKLLFNYSFAGSVGIAMASPSDPQFFESDLRHAVDILFELASGDDEQVHAHAEKLGKVSIRKLYNWAKVHVDINSGIEIIWRTGADSFIQSLISKEAFRDLELRLFKVTDIIEDRRMLSGELVGADVKNNTFHFVADDGLEIRGKYSKANSEDQHIELPMNCIVEVLKHTELRYTTDDEVIRYELLRIMLADRKTGDETQ